MFTASISWTYSLLDNTGFLLQRSTDSGSTWPTTYQLPAAPTDYFDTTVEVLGTYWYRVAAINHYGIGTYSNTGSVFVPPLYPLGPYHLVVTSGSAILTWQSGSSNQDYFAIQKSLDGDSYIDLDVSTVVNYTDVLVSASVFGNTYWYQVAAVNAYGTSSFSNTASITFTQGGGSPPSGPPDISGSISGSTNPPGGTPDISGSVSGSI
jgi:hypothetical protein